MPQRTADTGNSEYELPLPVLLGPVVALLLLLLFGIDVAVVRGESMAPLLRDGQVVFVNQAAYGIQAPFLNSYLFLWDKPRKDDIVVFDSPADGRLAVKRCVAVPGDSIVVGDAVVVAGGETYDVSLQVVDSLQNLARIPDNMVFVVGDNRGRSTDSRHYGLLPLRSIRGRLLAPRSTVLQGLSE
ncbi:MAG: signal peptidase I [Spirochaetaceae bacterium]|nr:MAG: signal peptidase I [Spirochaetaceae bacterium]